MFTERTRQITPKTTTVAVVRPRPRVSVVEHRPHVSTPLLNSALNIASQLTELATIRKRIKLEHARAAAARVEATALPPTLQPTGDLVTKRQEFPWTFVLLGGGALILALFLSKRK